MAEQLIIHLKDIYGLNAEWFFCQTNADTSTPVDSGPLSQLTDKNKNAIDSVDSIVCIINAELIHFSYQNIPAKNMQRALQAIPFALEEQLAEDIELMHFATSKAHHSIYPVAAIKHESLALILSALRDNNINPDYLYPDILCLPQTANSWNFICLNETISIDQGINSVIHSDPEMFPVVLQALLQQTNDDLLPDTFEIWSPDDNSNELLLPQPLPENIQLNRHKYSSAVGLFSANLNNKNQVNLLQGRYQILKQSRQWWKPWLNAAVLAAILFTLQLISGAVNLNKVSQQNKLLNSEINNIYKKSFPASKKIVNARVQMQSKLKQLQKSNGKAESSFVDILTSTASTIKQSSSIEIQGMNYHKRKLEIQLTIDKLSSAEQLIQQLNKLNTVKAELISASSESKLVSARIKLEAL